MDTDTRHQLPSGIDTMEPGAALAACLTKIDVRRLSGYDQVLLLRAHQRLSAHFASHVYNDIAAIAEATEDTHSTTDPYWQAEGEIRAALTLTRSATQNEMTFAIELHQRLPAVADLLSKGLLSVPKARVFERELFHLPTAQASEIADRVLGDAPDLTTGQLRARIQRLRMEANPDDAQDRYTKSLEDRRVTVTADVDGTAELHGAHLPAARAAEAIRNVNRYVRQLKRGGDDRTADQLRADVALDLLRGVNLPEYRSGGGIEIRTDLTTLAEMSDRAAEIPGYGPVIADIARKVAEEQQSAQWRFSVADPADGSIVSTGTTRRRPTADVRRKVLATYPRCVFPGCRMPASDCDLDHRTTWAEGGETTFENLAPLCRNDHRTRHEAGWSIERMPNGDHQWTSMLGHAYTTRPPPF